MVNEEFYEQFHEPLVRRYFDWGWLRRTSWTALSKRDFSDARFVSWWFMGHLQWYHGTAKCNGSLSEPTKGLWIMTDKPSEMTAFRWRANGPGEVHWNNMGGC